MLYASFDMWDLKIHIYIIFLICLKINENNIIFCCNKHFGLWFIEHYLFRCSAESEVEPPFDCKFIFVKVVSVDHIFINKVNTFIAVSTKFKIYWNVFKLFWKLSFKKEPMIFDWILSLLNHFIYEYALNIIRVVMIFFTS